MDLGDFEQLIQDIEAEARAEGPAAAAELAALEARFSLAAELIARRTGLGMTQKQAGIRAQSRRSSPRASAATEGSVDCDPSALIHAPRR